MGYIPTVILYTGYETSDDLAFKQDRLKTISQAKHALEKREQDINPNKKICDKKQISFSDHDARIMEKKGGSFDYSYNPQVSVDGDHQIIVGQHVSQKANDKQEVKSALETIEQTSDQKPEIVSLDNGYMSGENLQVLENSQIDCYVTINKGEKKNKEPLDQSNRKLIKSDFDYDEKCDKFICPGDQELLLIQENKDGSKLYQGDINKCNSCEFKDRCCQSTKDNARTISTDAKEPLRMKMNKKMELEESKKIYKKKEK